MDLFPSSQREILLVYGELLALTRDPKMLSAAKLQLAIPFLQPVLAESQLLTSHED